MNCVNLLLRISVLLMTSKASLAAENAIPPQFLLSWGGLGDGDGQFAYPQDVAVSPAGNVYVADTSHHRVQRFSSDGTFISTWDVLSPFAVDVGADGMVYVASFSYIEKFTEDGVRLLQFGSQGAGEGEFDYIQGLATSPNGTIYVADFRNYRVQQFTDQGEFIRKWGNQGQGDGEFEGPVGIAVDDLGNVYVVDNVLPWVQKFTAEGQFISRFLLQNAPDLLVHDVAVLPGGTILVVEQGFTCISMLDSSGFLFLHWGSRGSENGEFQYPMGIAVDRSGAIYVVDYGNHRIQKFSYSTGVSATTWGHLKQKFQRD